MSLEKSMADLAESNLKLAEAQNNLAEAQQAVASRYEEMIAFFAANQGNAPAAAASSADTPAKTEDKPKRGRPAKAKPEPEVEDDGLGGEEEEATTQRTADEVKSILKQYKEAGGTPRDIMGKFGAKAFPEVAESDYNACYEATEKALAKL